MEQFVKTCDQCQRAGKPNDKKKAPLKLVPVIQEIVRVQYFVRGGFVGHRSRASSKHLISHLPVDGLDSSGVKQGLRCSCKLHVWVSGSQRSRPLLMFRRSDVTI
ncbi:hypothetical protein TNCV_3336321 [Trichonephila clavipes]|nr:hypothetical protein TNCV_3336321 [Trichonephila clavipes]